METKQNVIKKNQFLYFFREKDKSKLEKKRCPHLNNCESCTTSKIIESPAIVKTESLCACPTNKLSQRKSCPICLVINLLLYQNPTILLKSNQGVLSVRYSCHSFPVPWTPGQIRFCMKMKCILAKVFLAYVFVVLVSIYLMWSLLYSWSMRILIINATLFNVLTTLYLNTWLWLDPFSPISIGWKEPTFDKLSVAKLGELLQLPVILHFLKKVHSLMFVYSYTS